MSANYIPPYSVTETITNLIVEIGEAVGSLTAKPASSQRQSYPHNPCIARH